MQAQLLSKIAEGHRRLSRWTWFGTMEASALLFGIAYLDYAHVLPANLFQMQPHPFWIPVVLASTCYGRSSAYFVAICATALDGALNWSAFAAHPDVYDFLITNSKNAILWLAAAAILGRFRERQLERLKASEDVRDQRTDEARILAERCRALAREAATLERRIASSGSSAAGSVLEIFQKVLRLPGARSVDGYKQALHLLIGAKDIEIYVPVETGWMALSGSNQSLTKAIPPELRDALESSDGVLSCMRPADAKFLDGHAAMAACIRSKSGQRLAIVLIGEVDPACMTTAGEAAISLGNFILGSRYLENEVSLLETQARHPKLQLKVVNGEPAKVQSSS
jgi:hypothetical protein